MKSLLLAVVLFAFFIDGSSIVRGDEIIYATMEVQCRFDGRNFPVNIPLDATNGFVTWGAMTLYIGNDGKDVPCPEANIPSWNPPMLHRYSYQKVDVDMNWSVVLKVGLDANGGNVYHTFTKADNKAYWDHYYEGYLSVGGLDYEQNCHGYAFGVGDWPTTAHAFIGSGWGDQEFLFPSHEEPVIKSSSEQFKESGVYKQYASLCPDSVNINKAHSYPGFVLYKQFGSCYKFAQKHRATIASNVLHHTIKITGGECPLPQLPRGGPIN